MPRKSKRQAIRRRRGPVRPRVPEALSSPPPPFSPDAILPISFRYVATSSGQNVPINRQMILNLMVFGVNSNTGYRMFSSVRVTRIRIWTAAVTAAAGGANYASSAVQWAGQSSRPKTMFSESMGLGTVAHLDTRPPAESQASFWCNDNYLESDVLFSLDTNAGDVVHLDVVAVLQNGVTAQYTANSITTTSTIATGRIYAVALDHYSNSYLAPLGYSSCL